MQETLAEISLKNEEWENVVAGYYISTFGRWYSASTNTVLIQELNSSGYYRARVYLGNGRRKSYLTHIYVVKYFGDCNGKKFCLKKTLREQGLSIDHINRDKSNNSIYNLELVTHVENCNRKFREIDELCGDLPY